MLGVPCAVSCPHRCCRCALCRVVFLFVVVNALFVLCAVFCSFSLLPSFCYGLCLGLLFVFCVCVFLLFASPLFFLLCYCLCLLRCFVFLCCRCVFCFVVVLLAFVFSVLFFLSALFFSISVVSSFCHGVGSFFVRCACFLFVVVPFFFVFCAVLCSVFLALFRSPLVVVVCFVL